MADNKIIMYDSPEAAEFRKVTGWVSRGGLFHGDNEHTARWQGCTHLKCDSCGEVKERSTWCRPCHDKKEREKYKAMPAKDWDGEAMLYSNTHDKWFSDFDDILDYMANCDDADTLTFDDLEMVIGDPCYCDTVDPMDVYESDLPDGYDLPDGIEEAFEELNKKIQAIKTPLCWYAGSHRMITPKEEMDGAV